MSFLSLQWKLRDKILILFIVIAFVPFSLVNIFWYLNAQNTVRRNVEQNIVTATTQGAQNVNSFLDFKLLGMLSHSQGAALLSDNEQLIKDDLLNFLLQDADIISLTYVKPNGDEFVKVDKNKIFPPQALVNIKNSDEFKIAAFKFGKEYISPVTFNNRGIAEITISTPIFYPTYSSSLQSLSSVQHVARTPDEIFGVLIERISLERLQNDISSITVGNTGYMYLIDNKGSFIAHREKRLLGTIAKANDDTEIHRFLGNTSLLQRPTTPTPNIGRSLDLIPVLSAHVLIDRTNWAIITEQTLDETLDDISRIQNQALMLFMLSLLGIVGLSFFVARSLTSPIEKLAEASIHIGRGDFDYPLSIKSGDELEHLAGTYTQMARDLKADHFSLIAEKNTLSTVLNNTADGVIGLDEGFRIVLFNRAFKQIAYLEDSDIVGKTFDAVVTIREKENLSNITEFCKETDDTLHKVVLTTPAGKSRNVTLTAVAVPSSIVSPIRYIVTLYDLSKEQELETMKIDFVSMAAHELRTPLTIIRGYLSIFISENEHTFSADQKLVLNRINIAAQQLVSLVESLLNVTHMEKVGFNLNPASAEWVPLVKKTVDDLKNRAQEKKIRFKLMDTDSILPNVVVDEQRITEVLVNIFTNAIKYSYPDTEILIWFETDGKVVKTYVKDHGPGIPPEAIPQLFNKFYRVPGHLEQTAKGTGLGLYISKKIVELHNGNVWVESQLGNGSTFGFSVPVFIEKKK